MGGRWVVGACISWHLCLRLSVRSCALAGAATLSAGGATLLLAPRNASGDLRVLCCLLAELLCSLWVLETAGIVEIKCRLRGEQGQAEGAPSDLQEQPSPDGQQQQGAEQASAGGSGSRDGRCSKSREPPPQAGPSAAAAAAGGGRSARGPMRGAKTAAIQPQQHRQQQGADQAGPSRHSGRRGPSPAPAKAAAGKAAARKGASVAAVAVAPAALPRALQVEVWLTEEVRHQLWWSEDSGDLSEQMEGDKGKGKGGGKAKAGGSGAQVRGSLPAAVCCVAACSLLLCCALARSALHCSALLTTGRLYVRIVWPRATSNRLRCLLPLPGPCPAPVPASVPALPAGQALDQEWRCPVQGCLRAAALWAGPGPGPRC